MAVLRTLDIENYQALGSAHLELGQFTVVTGPTGSGKSAVIRALKMAVFNARGTSFIRHGTKTAKVFLTDSAGLGVALVRGSRDAYVLDVLGEQKTFTKLGGQVPEEVAALLAFSDLNFAGQLDRPFLLDASGSQVARILGKLTNVDLVFEAARRGYARKQEISRRLKSVNADLEDLTQAAEQYACLPARLAAQEQAEQCAERAEQARDRQQRLFVLYRDVVNGAEAVQEAAAVLKRLEPPSLTVLDTLVARRDRMKGLFTELLEASSLVGLLRDRISVSAGQEKAAHDAVHDALVEAGTCPTCGLTVPR